MAADVTNKITDTRNAARPNSARVTSGRSTGGATLACDNLAGWPTASKVHFVTYRVDSSSNPVAGTQLDCYGIVSGNNITSFTVIDGTDTGNAVNDYVEMLPTAAWGQDLADGLMSQHTRTGAHGVITATSITTTGNATIGGSLSVTGTTTLTALSNPYKFYVYRNAALNSANTYTAVAFDTKVFDTGTNVDVVTNKGRFTAPIAGFYWFAASVGNTTATGATGTALFKNGSAALVGTFMTSTAASSSGNKCHVSGIIQLAANDYVEAYFIGGSGSSIEVGSNSCWYQGYLLSVT